MNYTELQTKVSSPEIDLDSIIYLMLVICPRCKQENTPANRFCAYCGNPLIDHSNSNPVAILDAGYLNSEPTSHPLWMDRHFSSQAIQWPYHSLARSDSQRRYVAVLFTDLGGYTEAARQLENEVLYELMQQYINLLAEEIYKYEGMVNKLTGDGVMAIFGAPIAHENNVERALRAALEMQTKVAAWSNKILELFDLQLRMRTGIHAGPVIVGGISDLLTEYTAIGETVNLAHRIEEAAPPGQILVSQAVYQQTKFLFDFEVIEPLRLKGFNQAVTCFRLIGIKNRPPISRHLDQLEAPLIDRQVELGRLQAASQALLELKTGNFILLTGEAGIGKTRLVQEFIKTLDSRMKIIEARSLTYRRSLSYWLFNEAVRNYLKIPAGVTAATLSEKIEAAAQKYWGAECDQFLPFLLNFFSLPARNNQPFKEFQHLDAPTLRQRTFQVIANLLLTEASEKPLIFILEDLHWADDASLELLKYLLAFIPQKPFLLIGIARNPSDERLDKLITWANEILPQHFHHLEMSRLDAEHSRELLENLLPGGEIQTSLSSQLIERAGGVPLYLEEVLRAMIASKAIKRYGNQWVAAQDSDPLAYEAPVSLQGIILSRYDQLPDERKRILQVACVIGHQFNSRLLATVLGLGEANDLNRHLDQLVEEGFLTSTTQDQDSDYAFKHVLFSEVIYNAMLKRDRSDIHAIIGQAIETLYPGQEMDHAELLARHYSWSSNFPKALQYLILAGQKAIANFVNEQAKKHFEHALALLPIVDHTLDQALQVQIGLGDVYSALGDYQSAKRHYLAALNRLNQEGTGQSQHQQTAILEKLSALNHQLEENLSV